MLVEFFLHCYTTSTNGNILDKARYMATYSKCEPVLRGTLKEKKMSDFIRKFVL